MKTPKDVHLGFEVGTGKGVAIPIRHMAITGQTQESGKTTTLEALVERSAVRAVTFVTKRGERAFAGGRRIPPFFRERADWVFVSSLIDATLGEKNKLLRAWLMKVCRNTTTLADVQRNVREARATARGFNESIYTEIEGYLELVVPQLSQLPPHTAVTIGAGLNVMDLSPYSTELQALVIRSVLEHVYEHEAGVITVIPEAWEFLPEGRGSPVKRDAETLIRKGATLGNYMWLDSQDLGGVWKLALRACSVVLIGVQREANEIKRTLDNIPAGTAKPTKADIAHLELGQFYACWGRHAVKTYVQPAWMAESSAICVAQGTRSALETWQLFAPDQTKRAALAAEEEMVNAAEAQALRDENAQLKTEVDNLRRHITELVGSERADHDGGRVGGGGKDSARESRPQRAGGDAAAAARHRTATEVSTVDRDVRAPASLGDQEALYQAFKARLIEELPSDPRVMAIVVSRPELQVQVKRHVLEVDGDTLRGRVARLIADGFFDNRQTGYAAFIHIKETWRDPGKANVYKHLDALNELGFVTKTGDGYEAVSGMKVRIVEAR